MADHAPAVRRRPPLRRGLSRQALILVLLIAVAFGTAIYMGVRHPYQTPAARQPVEPLRMTVIPLAPQGRVPGAADAEYLYAHSPAAQFRVGAEGITAARLAAHRALLRQPGGGRPDHRQGLPRASPRSYPDVLTGGQHVRSVRVLLDPRPARPVRPEFRAPGRRRAARAHRLAGSLRPDAAPSSPTRKIRVAGHAAGHRDRRGHPRGHRRPHLRLRAAARPAPDAHGPRPPCSPSGASCTSASTATTCACTRPSWSSPTSRPGPLSCAEDSANHLRPLLAGQTAKAGGPAGTDPYATGGATALCGSLAPSAQPKV